MTKHKKIEILDAALDAARDLGLGEFTRDDVAEYAGAPASLVSYHWGSMDELRKHVVARAAEVFDVDVARMALGLSPRELGALIHRDLKLAVAKQIIEEF